MKWGNIRLNDRQRTALDNVRQLLILNGTKSLPAEWGDIGITGHGVSLGAVIELGARALAEKLEKAEE